MPINTLLRGGRHTVSHDAYLAVLAVQEQPLGGEDVRGVQRAIEDLSQEGTHTKKVHTQKGTHTKGTHTKKVQTHARKEINTHVRKDGTLTHKQRKPWRRGRKEGPRG